MGHPSAEWRRAHAIDRAWQRHRVELGSGGYDVICRHIRRGAAQCLLRESATVAHYRVFYDGVYFVAIFDHVQDRILTILPQATYFTVALRDQFLVFRAPRPAPAKYVGECQWCRARVADDHLTTVGHWCNVHRCDKRHRTRRRVRP